MRSRNMALLLFAGLPTAGPSSGAAGAGVVPLPPGWDPDPPIVADHAPRNLPSAPRKRRPGYRARDMCADTARALAEGRIPAGEVNTVLAAIKKRASRAAKRGGGTPEPTPSIEQPPIVILPADYSALELRMHTALGAAEHIIVDAVHESDS